MPRVRVPGARVTPLPKAQALNPNRLLFTLPNSWTNPTHRMDWFAPRMRLSVSLSHMLVPLFGRRDAMPWLADLSHASWHLPDREGDAHG